MTDKTPFRLLYIEDEYPQRNALTKAFEKAGFTVTAFKDVKDALDELENDNSYDVVVTDNETLSKETGLDLAETWAKILPVIVYSSNRSCKERAEACNASFFHKSPNRSALISLAKEKATPPTL